jgi:hypothetical protein
MNQFKFFRENVNIKKYNGVTNPFLIELSENIFSYSDWIYSSMLSVDYDTNQDSLIIEFRDINNDNYYCQIFEDHSFYVLEIIGEFEEDREYIYSIEFSEQILSNYENLINYLKAMPKTFANSF